MLVCLHVRVQDCCKDTVAAFTVVIGAFTVAIGAFTVVIGAITVVVGAFAVVLPAEQGCGRACRRAARC